MKINYGINLGTTSASIARMENGVPVIMQTNRQRDKISICVAFTKRGILVGDLAYNVYRSEKENTLSIKVANNAFIEFTRTLGTDKTYYSSNADKSFTSTELVAEILKTLRSFIKDEDVKSAVITVPTNYRINQIDAVRQAGKLAGIQQVEIVQEPIAVSLAYGLDSIKHQGSSLVFSFKDDVFDVTLIKEGRIIDSEGDNYLGGQNLDFAIVDDIILSHIQKNYNIDNILSNDDTKNNYREALKVFAEELKNELSFKDSYNLYKEDRLGIDDDGEEIEIDVTITQSDITRALAPVFQKAIDVSLGLLKRNNLKGVDLDTLVLVGGDTLSPVLRGMLECQICKPDTSTDPMTVVSTGAALYASTIDVSDEVREQTRDTTKIQLEIAHESFTGEMEEYVPIKILEDKTDGDIPEKVFAKITRVDKAWSSGKTEIDYVGEVIEVQLLENKTNIFDVVLYDNIGNILECEPNSFSIKQGSKVGFTTLPYNIGTEIKQKATGKIVFSTIKGLDKNQSLPAIGTISGIKTKKPIRPGMDEDFIKIPLYQGEHASDGTRAIYNEHVYDIIISGNDLPALLPENSDMDLTISVDKYQKITVQAFFPYLDHTSEIEIPTNIRQSVETSWLQNEIRKAKGSILELKQGGNNSEDAKLNTIEKEIEHIEKVFENNKNDVDCKLEVLTNLRKSLKTIDEIRSTNEWTKLEEEIKEDFYHLEKANTYSGNKNSTELVNQLRNQVEEVSRTKDVKLGHVLLEEIQNLCSSLIKSITIGSVEDLLYELTENEVLTSSEFQIYFEELSNLKANKNADALKSIYKKLKEHE